MIFLECFLDTLFIEYLGYNFDDFTHSGSRGKVINHIKDQYDNFEKLLGIVDEDPNGTPPVIKDLKSKGYTIDEPTAHQIIISHHPDKPKLKIIVIPEDINKWIGKLSKERGVKIPNGLIDKMKNELKKTYNNKEKELLKTEVFENIKEHPGWKNLAKIISEFVK